MSGYLGFVLPYKSTIYFLASRKFIVILISLILLLLFVSIIIPQEAHTPRTSFNHWFDTYPSLSKLAIFFGATRIFTHPIFITVIGLLSVSLILCTYNRVFAVLKNTKRKSELDLSHLKRGEFCFELDLNAQLKNLIKGIERKIKGKGVRFTKSLKGDVFLFSVEKGHYGKWGSMVFHFSFIVLLIGALASVWTRFEGNFLLTEGQTFEGLSHEYSNKNNPPLFYPERLEFQLQLQKFIPSADPQKEYSQDRVLIKEENGKKYTKDIRKYHALTHHRFTFYQKEHGFSPFFILKSENGEIAFQSYVAFRTQRIGEDFLFEDTFEIPGSEYQVYGRLYPDAFVVDGKVDTRSNKPNNPLLSLTVSKQGKEVYRGDISLNQAIEYENYTLSFNDLLYWSSFRVVRDYGIPVLYFGFFMGIMGLMIRLLSNRQEIIIEIKESREGCSSVKIYGKAEREKVLFAEKLNLFVGEIKNLERVQ